jgi:hypothetical protein
LTGIRGSSRSDRLLAAVLLAAAAAFGAFAEDAPIVTDDDALFADEGAGIEKVAEEKPGAAVRTFLKTEAVRVGGTFAGTLDSSWTWTDPWNGNRNPAGPDGQALTPAADAKVFFDARPEEGLRWYGSAKIFWPYEDKTDFRLFELFTDFNWQDKLFFRFGKHTVKWGVGYFWSPADVINLGTIDVTDPAAQREGPVSLRLHVPIPHTQNNLWAYAVVPKPADAQKAAEIDPEDLALAAKYEFLVGGYEIGAGAFYRSRYAPKAMLTATGALRKLNLFGEAVLGWGSDKTWVTKVSAAGPSAETYDDGLYFSGTAGFSYIDSNNGLTAYAQYYYNGEGYADADRNKLIDQANAALAILAAGATKDALSAAFKGMVYQSGRHYAGAFLTKTEAGNKKLTASVLAIANLSDLSGFVQPMLTWEFFSRCSLALSPTFYWSVDALWGAGENAEYTVLAGGPSVSVSLKATLGSGGF